MNAATLGKDGGIFLGIRGSHCNTAGRQRAGARLALNAVGQRFHVGMNSPG
jgi:hypothetical protein